MIIKKRGSGEFAASPSTEPFGVYRLSFLLPIPEPPVPPVDLDEPPSVDELERSDSLDERDEPDMPDEPDELDDPFMPPRDAELPIPSSFRLPRSVRLPSDSLLDELCRSVCGSRRTLSRSLNPLSAP